MDQYSYNVFLGNIASMESNFLFRRLELQGFIETIEPLFTLKNIQQNALPLELALGKHCAKSKKGFLLLRNA